jgi:hypothetical protein
VPNAASISAQSYILGEIQSDPSALRGEGGPSAPALVIPLTIVLHPRPAEQAVAITDLHAQIHVGPRFEQTIGQVTRISEPSSPQGPWISNPSYAATYSASLTLPIPLGQMHTLEMLPAFAADIPVRIGIETRASAVAGEHALAWGVGGGSALELWPLSWVRTEELQLAVPGSQWATQLLPGIGADRYRTVLIALPTRSPLTPMLPLLGGSMKHENDTIAETIGAASSVVATSARRSNWRYKQPGLSRSASRRRRPEDFRRALASSSMESGRRWRRSPMTHTTLRAAPHHLATPMRALCC